jgi:signal transduction histidine kinase
MSALTTNWRSGGDVFKLMRFYSITSLAGFVVTAVLLMVFVRQLVIGDIVQLAQRSTLTLVNSILNSVRSDLIEFLDGVQDAVPHRPVGQELPARLAAAIVEMMRDGSVVRIKVYNRRGVVVFSTKSNQIGDTQEDNAGFASALDGRVHSTVVYRDTFNRFDQETEEDNLMQTYVPARGDPAKPISGVLEIYTDITSLVYINERTEFGLLALVGLLLAFLYGVLILIMRHATKIIDSQQNTIRGRTAALEMLSAQMLKSGEMEKKKIAFDLHEGLAQTLTAIKTYVEGSRGKSGSAEANTASLEQIVPVLQGAISEVRAIATELRPSSLDGLGLLPTIRWFCREFEQLHPGKRIEQNLALQENDLPAALKIVLYRIVESALKNLVWYADAVQFRLDLRLDNQAIVLTVENSPQDSSYAATTTQTPAPDLPVQFVEARERTTLSGGTFSIGRNAAGGVRLQCRWDTAGAAAAFIRTAGLP